MSVLVGWLLGWLLPYLSSSLWGSLSFGGGGKATAAAVAAGWRDQTGLQPVHKGLHSKQKRRAATRSLWYPIRLHPRHCARETPARPKERRVTVPQRAQTYTIRPLQKHGWTVMAMLSTTALRRATEQCTPLTLGQGWATMPRITFQTMLFHPTPGTSTLFLLMALQTMLFHPTLAQCTRFLCSTAAWRTQRVLAGQEQRLQRCMPTPTRLRQLHRRKK